MKLKVRGRVNLIGAMAAIGLVALLCISLFRMSAIMHADIERNTRQVVETARSVVAYYHNAELAGRMSRAEAQRAALSTLKDMRYEGKEYFWVNDLHPTMLMHPTKPELDNTDLTNNRDATGKAHFVEMANVVKARGEGFVRYMWKTPDKSHDEPKLSYVAGFKPWGWVIGSGVYLDSVNAAVWSAALYQSALALAVLLVVAFVAFRIGRSISQPVEALSARMRALAAGDTATPIPGRDRIDEVGEMAAALETFRDAAIVAADREAEQQRVVATVGSGLDALAHGRLDTRIGGKLSGTFAKIGGDFDSAMAAVADAMRSVTRSAGGIRTGATEISSASDDLSRRTEQQAASLEETAAALDQITATVRRTAAGAAQANTTMSATRGDAEDGVRIVREAVTAMSGIKRASDEISEIISVIDGIAFQTNLLALNAGVEAARAGDAGKGFAVVASEVCALAQRSADAANDVKSRIHASGSQVEVGVTLVGQTGSALERIVARIAEIADLVATIARGADEQSSGLQQVNIAVSEMDAVTQQNAAMVEEATAAARSLASEAEALTRHVARFSVAETAGRDQPRTLRAVA
ncbi:hypothetical protein ASE50_01435 [Sphingomonas sp. Leaf5]|uniref:methyl-accepting chemotaxis protein n=1 Tax=Sphingomonas sp. Leaf5 TaxID=1735671 RepID=UPI0006FB2FE4|nr:methyl-accepting chemotaxis protein [Sphingomonas sp. Leaf5]KQM22923.1 hypothetical protein ASE50_01435 [Sphingomonas sp. Leaf5]